MPVDEDFADTQDQMQALAIKGKNGGRKAAPGAGSEQQKRDLNISKALSMLLRHKAEEAGIELDDEGFARLDKVVSFFLGAFFC